MMPFPTKEVQICAHISLDSLQFLVDMQCIILRILTPVEKKTIHLLSSLIDNGRRIQLELKKRGRQRVTLLQITVMVHEKLSL